MSYNMVIAGAGGIAQAVGLIMADWGNVPLKIFIGNRTLERAEKVAHWIGEGTTNPGVAKAFWLSESGLTQEMEDIFTQGDVLLDCLPGSLAPKMASYAKDFKMHYVNLTEYVAETNEIIALAKNAETGFVLQSGLAPGYINLLAHHLFQEFCIKHKVDKVDKLQFKVGALTDHAVAPHYYGFTWSPVGVATEYVKDAEAVRNYKKVPLKSLSERATIIIDGRTYEEDLTSGGAADLPDALAGKVRDLDYKTLRYPGHYAWVQQQLAGFKNVDASIKTLQEKMESEIPHIENDQIVLYAAVEGKDTHGVLRRSEVSKLIFPQKVGIHRLRAIQTTTAAPMVQAAFMLMESEYKGVVLQSQIDPKPFLNGNFIAPIYGYIN
ncbi:saccharopine dehydrogenase C-terminal domain-containing protein [Arenibacter sp. F20364]|uniref:saccharopine dehydrogenase family protein n=1 Tax=Arenibacter sp. F20364 TaxID=2926415 RepID=UPI001FF3CE2E|nr:saccharopine dehydrogenase C-terminal domain-containing protein [Arenibacter sp. F20364]MCK0189345.1 saccharopine dehydrogenase NADP-binding domain-containing protein [Arenibacter sp. F20364]